MNTFRTNLQALTSVLLSMTWPIPTPTRDALHMMGAVHERLGVESAEVGAGTCTLTAHSGGEQLRMPAGHLAALAQQAAEVALLAGLPDNLAAPMNQRSTAITWGDPMPFGAIVVEASAGSEQWAAATTRTITVVGRTTHATPVTIFSAAYAVALVAKA